MDDDSDDDKPVMAAVMKLNAVKQEGEKNGKVIIKQEGEKNGKENKAEKALNGKNSSASDSAATEKSKPSSSSSKSSRDSTTSANKRPRGSTNTEISDDDIPIADLMTKRRLAKDKTSAVSDAEIKVEKIEKVVAAPKKVSTHGIGSEFYDTKKGMIAQRLLCRWWYAIDWPILAEIGNPPAGYEPLEGFLGVFVSTRTDSLGTIVDLRNKETAPCLSNFAKMDTTELKGLCILAYEKQMAALAAAEGDKGKLMSELKLEIKEVKAVSTDKAEKEGQKYLKSSK